MTIVLDTNCLIQILPKEAEHRWLFDAIIGSKISLAVTTEILNEYEEILNSFFESETLGSNISELISNLPNTKRIDIYYKWRLIAKDPDDLSLIHI